jgi:uncharacterized Zn finger protein (UPF0148 family)
MITCPYCGTPNRRGSKYCSNCGQRLEAVAAITCAACERLNPPGSTYCAFCGALLTPGQLARENAVEQPVEPLAESGKQELESAEVAPRRELPSWLYEEPAISAEATIRPPAAPQAVAVHPSAERSKYLQDIQGVLPSTDRWLLSSMQRGLHELTPAANEATGKELKKRKGCLAVGLVALWYLIGHVLFSSQSANGKE